MRQWKTVLPALLALIQVQNPAYGSGALAADCTRVATSRDEPSPHRRGPLEAGCRGAESKLFASVRNHITLREYHASENSVGLQAPNRRHALRTYFEPTGIRVVERVAQDSTQLLALRLLGYGRANALDQVAPGRVSSAGGFVEIHREALLEWYVNSPAGIQQGFVVQKTIAGKGPLVLSLALEGAEASRVGDLVRMVSATGRTLTYGQVQAVDAQGNALPVQLSVPNAHRVQLNIDDTNAVYPIVIDPMLTATTGTLLESDQAGALFGFSVAGAGDVNGDGYADVIVGAWRYDAGETDEGAAFVFHGGAAGVVDASPTTANAQLHGGQAGAELGEYVASAGDVNGDGYDDVIVGAWHYDSGETDEGAAFIFHGSPGGIGNRGADRADAQLQGNQAGAELGVSVGGAGDVNGDGYDDVVVGAWHYDDGETDEGAAFVFHGSAEGIAHGSPSTAQTRLVGGQAGAQMGISVDGAGDVNSDGYADVIVGAHTFDAPEDEEGAAFVFLGSASGISGTTSTGAHSRIEGDQPGAWMGVNVGGAGDVNGDGFADVIVGARRYDTTENDAGAAFVFHGSATGIPSANPATAQTRLVGDQADAWLGYSVDGAGDVNGDGYDDVIVGAGRYDAGERDDGAAFLFLGAASGIAHGNPRDAGVLFIGDQPRAFLGSAVSGADDVNGDGFSDLVIGAYQQACGQNREGTALVFLGGAMTPSAAKGPELISLGDRCGSARWHPRVPMALAVFTVLAGGAGLLALWRWRRGNKG